MESKTSGIEDLKYRVYFKGYSFRLSLDWSLELHTYYKLENTGCTPEMPRIFPCLDLLETWIISY